jgi:hypothetical protein
MKLKDGRDIGWQNVTLGELYTELDWHHPHTTDKDRNLYSLLKLWLDGHAGFDMSSSLRHFKMYYEKIYKEHYKNQ